MQRFCVDRRVLGSKEHLVVDVGSCMWASEIPVDTWHLDGTVKDRSEWCLDSALRLTGASLELGPPEQFVKEMSLFSGSLADTDVPWQRVMPERAHRTFVKGLIGRVAEAMATAPLDYYRTVWMPGNAIIGSLQRCAVDPRAWRELVDAGQGNLPALRSFKPADDGLADPVVYDRFRTLTGRLTVRSGPQILTLKREHRKVMTSVYGDDGCIVAFDFANLEARILLYEYGRRCDDVDLYGVIARELGYDRKAIKGAVISELYGSSRAALGRHLGIGGRELDEFISKIKTYFNTADLLSRVKSQFIATGKLVNRYGRPVCVDEPLDNILISYYGQSTGVDVTMLGFSQVLSSLKTLAPSARPVFLLHDAILVDIKKSEIESARNIQFVKVKGYVQKFVLKLEQIN